MQLGNLYPDHRPCAICKSVAYESQQESLRSEQQSVQYSTPYCRHAILNTELRQHQPASCCCSEVYNNPSASLKSAYAKVSVCVCVPRISLRSPF